MKFKEWFIEAWDDFDDWGDDDEGGWAALDTLADKQFGQRKQNSTIDFNMILKYLGLQPISGQPKKIKSGSFSNVYLNPHNPQTVIKVTADANDVKNIEKAQRLRSPNIVRLHNVVYLNPQTTIALLDYIQGNELRMSASELMALCEDGYQAASQQIITPNPLQAKVLRSHQMNNKVGRAKFSRLFATLAKLESMKIPVDDLAENIIDNGVELVLVDLGL